MARHRGSTSTVGFVGEKNDDDDAEFRLASRAIIGAIFTYVGIVEIAWQLINRKSKSSSTIVVLKGLDTSIGSV